MLPELHTERLVVALARPGMHGAMARFIETNFHGHLARWSPPPEPGLFTEDFWRERLALAVDEFHADRAARFVMRQRATPGGEIIGTCSYTNIVRGAFQACHLGYQIGQAYEGRGLMTEALRATNGFVFEGLRLHRIMANYRPENARSARVLERLGFEREGLAREYLFIDGAWRDHVLTSLRNPHYERAWIAREGS
ncbi:MAG TPA: GNAT family N-acetyltransferase [Usitatibacter sp.]|jgi:[ribosomal protein S5]-alanine N-acetyltransferase|nr:GNAT family N-acetyltransferase [Usitatibacter sp.]